MPAYVKKNYNDILRLALEKLMETTPLTAIGPGSIVRALTESITTEVTDLYSIMDFNSSMGFLSTAKGRALDLLGNLYNVERKRLTELATIDEQVGAFYFYIDEPHGQDITIPAGTKVFTSSTDYVESRYVYNTVRDAIIPAGRLKVYAALTPDFLDSIFTSGANTLVNHNFVSPAGTSVKCINPKPIAAQTGYETDDNLRIRIIKEVRASAGGTMDALRFTALAVAGVRDVRVRNNPYGLGTSEVIVVAEDPGAALEVVTKVESRLATVVPVGIRTIIREPAYVNCDLTALLVLRPDVNVDPEGTRRRAEIGIMRFLNRLTPGQTLVYNQMIQAILDASDAIYDASITRLRIGGVEVLRRNYNPTSDQQIVPGELNIRIATP